MDFNDTNMTDPNNTTNDNGGYSPDAYIHYTVASAVAIALCLFGIVGNVIVFWFLAFRIKRNKYSVYIINLAVADVIFLLFTAITMMIYINTLIGENPHFTGKQTLYTFIEIFYDIAQYSGMFFLTAISMERCLSVMFPMWYHCNRPKNSSSIVCLVLWFVGCSESLIENLACPPEKFAAQTNICTGVELMTFTIGVGICLPLMVLCSFALLIRVGRIFRRQYPPKLYIIIIIAVIIFILSVVPFSFIWFLMYFKLLRLDAQYVSLYYASVFSTSLNSTINPYIYFIVGRQWREKSHHSIHDALQRAFKDDDAVIQDANENSTSDKTNSSSCGIKSTDEEQKC
ncbi:mas-related G-protein coupled receptor member H-like [Pelobates fuscus]|uniref:mas-related G-protein coupled receptor member H-like n=1 Tax=Pelobates fuscus TaxID=191477 RepID=UPI002FE42C73